MKVHHVRAWPAAVILHADLDAFYAAVAQRDDPTLRSKPIAVAGSSRRAVVLTASYEARPFGVRSAMPLYRAKQLCPQLVVVPPAFQSYRAVSRTVFEILRQHAKAVESLSLDEAFLDAGEVGLDEAVAVARRIKGEVRSETSLAISIGVASSKLVSKIACDDGKPDGLVAVAPGGEAEYLADKPVTRLWGVGPKTAARLAERGIERIGQIAALDDAQLFLTLGRWGTQLRELARGVDTRPVSESDDIRSISSEETFEQDVTDLAVLVGAVREQARELAERLAERGLRALTVGVKIKTADFKIHGKQTTLAQATENPRIIGAAAVFCLKRADLRGRAVRLIGVRVSSLVAAAARQISLFGA